MYVCSPADLKHPACAMLVVRHHRPAVVIVPTDGVLFANGEWVGREATELGHIVGHHNHKVLLGDDAIPCAL